MLGLGLPWARDTAGIAERNGDQGGDGERAVGLPRSALTLLGQERNVLQQSFLHLGNVYGATEI